MKHKEDAVRKTQSLSLSKKPALNIGYYASFLQKPGKTIRFFHTPVLLHHLFKQKTRILYALPT
jgi:hypothetical protein